MFSYLQFDSREQLTFFLKRLDQIRLRTLITNIIGSRGRWPLRQSTKVAAVAEAAIVSARH
jgi:hypothetical protein